MRNKKTSRSRELSFLVPISLRAQYKIVWQERRFVAVSAEIVRSNARYTRVKKGKDVARSRCKQDTKNESAALCSHRILHGVVTEAMRQSGRETTTTVACDPCLAFCRHETRNSAETMKRFCDTTCRLRQANQKTRSELNVRTVSVWSATFSSWGSGPPTSIAWSCDFRSGQINSRLSFAVCFFFEFSLSHEGFVAESVRGCS